jgi:hypothetical protein
MESDMTHKDLMALADDFACYVSNGATVNDQGRRATLRQAIEALQKQLEQEHAARLNVAAMRDVLRAELEAAHENREHALNLYRAKESELDALKGVEPDESAPQAPAPLTDEQIKAIYQKYGTGRADGFAEAVRAIEKAHGITGEAQG